MYSTATSDEEDWEGLAATQGVSPPTTAPRGRAERAVRPGTQANGQPQQPARPEPVQPEPNALTPRVAKVRSISKANPVQKADLKGLSLAEKPTLSHLKDEVLRRKPEERPGHWTAEKCLNTLNTSDPPLQDHQAQPSLVQEVRPTGEGKPTQESPQAGQPEPEPARLDPVPSPLATLTPRVVKTRSICKVHPVQKTSLKGLSLKEKPTLSHLRKEVLRRHPDKRPTNWTAEKCLAVLSGSDPLPEPEPTQQPLVPGDEPIPSPVPPEKHLQSPAYAEGHPPTPEQG